MERFLQRDNNVLVNYISPVQRSSMDPSSSSSSLRNSADVDFHDVFGGPPRRYSSTQDARHSLSEARELSRFRGGDDETSASGSVRWSGLGDRPVFGDQEGGAANHRRRYPSEDFFDDIFRGGEDKDPYSSSPGSRVMSPARPLPPPKSDIFGSPSPSQFSLPATVNKGLELPSFGSPTRGPYSNKDEAQSVQSIPPSRSNSQSRLSSQSFKVQDEIRTDTRSAYRQSPLSIEFSLSSDGSVKVTDSETDSGETLKKDSNSSNVPISNSNQFHFSIYKWASKGVPLMVSLRSSNGAKVKESNLSRCLSSKGRIERDGVVYESPTETRSGVDFSSSNHNVSATTESNRMEGRKEDTEVFVKETVAVATPEKEIVVDSLSTNKDVPDNNTISRSKPNSPLGRLRKHKEKVTAKLVEATHKTESRSIRSENDDGQGKDKTSRETATKDNMATTTVKVKSSTVVGAGRTLRKRDAKKTNHADEEVEKTALRSSPSETVDSVEGSKIKGKVKEFVKIFNKETLPPKRVPITDTQSQSYEWKDKEINVDLMKADDGIQHIHTINPDKDKKSENAEAMPSSIAMDNEKTSANASFKVHKDSKLSKKTNPVGESTSFTLNDAQDQKDVRSSTASITEDSKATFATIDDFFEDDFSVKEISEDQHMLITQSGKDEEDFKASDAKIRGWASGKETNIRSLLSTLQYVLWPESGWKPVPLVDIIEASAVKRSYQRALLYLHPDKLQQKGADAHKKYIAEQVFDKLQDAWIHFNSLGSL